jgi:uncharacterized repeat protein (TIGR03803 family)
MNKLGSIRMLCMLFAFTLATSLGSTAQTFHTVATFDETDGAKPFFGSLVQGFDGRMYGTTLSGGDGGGYGGTVFAVDSAGTLTTIYNFCSQTNCADGDSPYSGLTLAQDGNFYGTTGVGGTAANCINQDGYGCGTIYKITPAGTLTTIYNFCSQVNCTDGSYPQAGLTLGADGNFYGVVGAGGVNGGGTIFKITPAGTFTVVYSFCSSTAVGGCPDGAAPVSGLVLGTNGNFYGTTLGGGLSNFGTVYEMTPSGKVTAIHSFCTSTNSEGHCSDGELPYAGLVQGSNGNFYGTTQNGGTSGYGTVFEVTSAGTLTTLYNFCSETNCADGALPVSGIMETNGNLYGTALMGGVYQNCSSKGAPIACGTVFEITPADKFTVLHTFCEESNCADGDGPWAALTQSTQGTLFGTTAGGGDSTCDRGDGCGTVFGLSLGLHAFVETVPVVAKTGAEATILGNNLTGTTRVTFNGAAASFTVVSDTEITASVPAGATSGTVEVTTPSGTLKSNVVFRVTQ